MHPRTGYKVTLHNFWRAGGWTTAAARAWLLSTLWATMVETNQEQGHRQHRNSSDVVTASWNLASVVTKREREHDHLGFASIQLRMRDFHTRLQFLRLAFKLDTTVTVHSPKNARGHKSSLSW